jgi:hypothetical protein
MKKSEIILLSVVFIALAAIRIFIPWANFNPVGAIALMGGVLFGKRAIAYAIPLGALFLGDLLLTSTSPMHSEYLFSSSFVLVYVAFALIIGLGMLLAKRPTLVNVVGGSLGASVIFFIVSNFGAWISLSMYPKTMAGLMTCMEAGLPFFRPTLVSQLVFSLAIYAIYAFATKRKIALA